MQPRNRDRVIVMSRLDVLIPHFRDTAGLARSLASVPGPGLDRRPAASSSSTTVRLRRSSAPSAALAESLDAGHPRAQPCEPRPPLHPQPAARRDRQRLRRLARRRRHLVPAESSRSQFEHLSRLRFQGDDTDRVLDNLPLRLAVGQDRPAQRRWQQMDVQQVRELMLGLTAARLPLDAARPAPASAPPAGSTSA